MAQANGDLSFLIERFSELEEMKTFGIEIDGHLAKRITFTLPKANCHLRTAAPAHVSEAKGKGSFLKALSQKRHWDRRPSDKSEKGALI